MGIPNEEASVGGVGGGFGAKTRGKWRPCHFRVLHARDFRYGRVFLDTFTVCQHLHQKARLPFLYLHLRVPLILGFEQLQSFLFLSDLEHLPF